MTETKKLVMVFKNSVGKNVSISIDDQKTTLPKLKSRQLWSLS